MPFYEYQCKNCGHTLEAMQKVNDSALKKCPQCGKSQLMRLMSAPVFRLKGGGWYETDFKGDSDHKKNLADRPDSDSSKDDKKPVDAKAAETTSDSAKPAEKVADKPAEKAAPAEASKNPSGPGISKRGATGTPRTKPQAAVKKAKPKTTAKAKARR